MKIELEEGRLTLRGESPDDQKVLYHIAHAGALHVTGIQTESTSEGKWVNAVVLQAPSR
jgi:hypothetical protein